MQEPLLFNTTIKENILYGNDKADDYKVWQAAQLANALSFIESSTLSEETANKTSS
jgi:ABC-type multidrug transport system fused ATPase/permease subunit